MSEKVCHRVEDFTTHIANKVPVFQQKYFSNPYKSGGRKTCRLPNFKNWQKTKGFINR